MSAATGASTSHEHNKAVTASRVGRFDHGEMGTLRVGGVSIPQTIPEIPEAATVPPRALYSSYIDTPLTGAVLFENDSMGKARYYIGPDDSCEIRFSEVWTSDVTIFDAPGGINQVLLVGAGLYKFTCSITIPTAETTTPVTVGLAVVLYSDPFSRVHDTALTLESSEAGAQFSRQYNLTTQGFYNVPEADGEDSLLFILWTSEANLATFRKKVTVDIEKLT